MRHAHFSVALATLTCACAGVPSGRSLPPVSLAAAVGRADHVIGLNDARVAAAGTTAGIAVTFAPLTWLELSARSTTGSLTAPENPSENHELSGLEADASLVVLPWLAATAGINARTYTGRLASQRWTAFRTGAEARLDLASGARGVIRASVFPSVTVQGLESPNLAIGGATGIELRRKRLFSSLLYSIDRYDFPSGPAGKRVEQLSSLVLQAGWRFGR